MGFFELFHGLAEEVFIVKIPKVVSLLACAFLLSLGLSHAALAIKNSLEEDTTVPRPPVKKPANTEVHAIKGEVLRLEGDQYLVKRSDGKQVSLRMDEATKVTRTFAPGEWIEAMVEQEEHDGHHALSIIPVPRQ